MTRDRLNVAVLGPGGVGGFLAAIEVADVAGTDEVDIDRDAVLHLLDSVPESMESSMQRDQDAGRPLELDALGGALLRRVAKAGIAVPVTRRLVDELHSRSGHPASAGSEL